MIAALLRRDLGLLLPGGRGGGGILPLLFFLAVAMLYPFAVGPDAQLLARTGGGVIWVAALLAASLSDSLHIRSISLPPTECGNVTQFSDLLRSGAPLSASKSQRSYRT